MPAPRRGESRDDYMDRCIPYVLDDGTAQDSRQAAAICSSMYDEAQKKRRARKVFDGRRPLYEYVWEDDGYHD